MSGGGTSLTEGADCSGFVQQIYKAYGYELPRVAQDQSQYGTQIRGRCPAGEIGFLRKKRDMFIM